MDFERYFKYIYFILAIACLILAIVDSVSGNHMRIILDIVIFLVFVCLIDINCVKERLEVIEFINNIK